MLRIPRFHTVRTLRGRLALMALASGALWVAVLTTAFNLALDKRLHEQADEVLRTRAEAVAATLEARPDGRLVVHEPAEDRALDTGVWIYQGTRVREQPPAAPAALARQADRLAGEHGVFIDAKGAGADATRLYAFPVEAASGHGQAGTVVTSVSLDPYRSTADTALAGSVALAVLLLGIIYLLTRLVVRRALRPVAAMSEQAGRERGGRPGAVRRGRPARRARRVRHQPGRAAGPAGRGAPP